MIQFVLRRSFFAIVLLLIVSAFTFWIFSALPADPAALTCGKNCRPEVIEANRARLGYDKPFIEQYGSYMKGIFAGRTYGEDTAGVHCSAPPLVGIPATPVTWISRTSSAPILVLVTVRRP